MSKKLDYKIEASIQAESSREFIGEKLIYKNYGKDGEVISMIAGSNSQYNGQIVMELYLKDFEPCHYHSVRSGMTYIEFLDLCDLSNMMKIMDRIKRSQKRAGFLEKYKVLGYHQDDGVKDRILQKINSLDTKALIELEKKIDSVKRGE